MKTGYRRKRRGLWLAYIAAFFIDVMFSKLEGAMDAAAIILSVLICAFPAVIIYSCVLTHKARVEDRLEFEETAQKMHLHPTAADRFLTEKCKKGEQNGWAEDVLIGLLGVPGIAMAVFMLFSGSKGTGEGSWMYALCSFGVAFFFIYMLMNRKVQRRKAREYALYFAAAKRGDYLYAALASDTKRGSAQQEVIRLLNRNYLMNIENDAERQQFNIIGFRRLPKNAYVCGNCGAAVSITVGAPLVCEYCGKPLV